MCPGVAFWQSAKQFTAMGAEVEIKRYAGRPHTVLPQEIKAARELHLQISALTVIAAFSHSLAFRAG